MAGVGHAVLVGLRFGTGGSVGAGGPSGGRAVGTTMTVGRGRGDGTVTVLVGSAVGLGAGSGVGGSEGVGAATDVGRGAGVGVVRVGPGTGVGAGASGRSRRALPAAVEPGGAGAAGSSGAAGGSLLVPVGPTGAVGSGASDGWLAPGITTGPTEGVGMNGVRVSGSAVLPTVADPVLIAARIGIDAVPASSATVKR